MIRLLKLSIIAACLAVPFLGSEARLPTGTRAFATGGTCRVGDKLTVLSDDGRGRVVVMGNTGDIGTVARVNLHPIDFTIKQ